MPRHYIIRNMCCRRFGFVTSRSASGFIEHMVACCQRSLHCGFVCFTLRWNHSVAQHTHCAHTSHGNFSGWFHKTWQFKLFDFHLKWWWIEILEHPKEKIHKNHHWKSVCLTISRSFNTLSRSPDENFCEIARSIQKCCVIMFLLCCSTQIYIF